MLQRESFYAFGAFVDTNDRIPQYNIPIHRPEPESVSGNSTNALSSGMLPRTDHPSMTSEPRIFISFSSTTAGEVAQVVYRHLIEIGLNVGMYTTDSVYKDLVSRYIDAIGKGGAIVAIVDDAYLRSDYCMWELLNISKNPDFQERLHPIVMDTARILDGVSRLEYTKYWQERKNRLTQTMQSVDPLSIGAATRAELKRISEFVSEVDALTSMVADMNFSPLQSIDNQALSILAECLKRQISSTFGPKTAKI